MNLMNLASRQAPGGAAPMGPGVAIGGHRLSPQAAAREAERKERMRVSRLATTKAKELLESGAARFPEDKPLRNALRTLERAKALEVRAGKELREQKESLRLLEEQVVELRTDPDGAADLSRITSLSRRADRLRSSIADDERLLPVLARKIGEATCEALLALAPLWRREIDAASARAEASRVAAKAAELVIAQEREKWDREQREIPVMAGYFTEAQALAREIGATS